MADEKRSDQDLIERLNNSRKRLGRARATVSFAIVVAATVNVLMIVFATRSFVLEQTPEVAAEVAKRIMPVAAKHTPTIRAMIDRLTPVYAKAFNEAMQSERPRMEAEFRKTYLAIEAHAGRRQPEVQKHIDALVLARQQDLIGGLEKVLGRKVSKEELDRVANMYIKAFEKKTDELWLASFIEHRNIIEELESNLARLARTEPDLNRQVDIQEAVGIMLEMTGIEMQQEMQQKS